MDSEGRLIVPLKDAAGKIWTLQTIALNGTKRFLTGGRKRGNYFGIGIEENINLLVLVEGFATGASVYEAEAFPVAAAMDAGNLKAVAEELRTKYPETPFLFAADNDENGRGEKDARETAQAVGGRVVVCPEPGDFNDLAKAKGLEAVREEIEAALKTPEPERNGGPKPRDGEPDNWPELEPLFRPLPLGEPFPLDALGEVLGGGARAIAEIRRVPKGAAGQSVFTCLIEWLGLSHSQLKMKCGPDSHATSSPGVKDFFKGYGITLPDHEIMVVFELMPLDRNILESLIVQFSHNPSKKIRLSTPSISLLLANNAIAEF